jgi:hypothetical protein
MSEKTTDWTAAERVLILDMVVSLSSVLCERDTVSPAPGAVLGTFTG